MSETKAKAGSVRSDLAKILESSDGADVTLVAGSLELLAHSQILAARSPVFAGMLRNDMREARSRRIEITDVEEAVLKQMLMFIYTDMAPELGSMAAELIAAADKYDVPLLKEKCEEKMVQDMSVQNAGSAAALAVLHRCPGLRDTAVKFIAGNLEVMATEGWARMLRDSAETAVEICQQVAAEAACLPRKEVSEERRHASLRELKRVPFGLL